MYSQAAQEFMQKELENAIAARQTGLEGKARVCARRAAGAAAKEYLTRVLKRQPEGTAYDLLGVLSEHATAPEPARKAARLLRLRVTEDYHLPVDADLIEEARLLIAALDSDIT